MNLKRLGTKLFLARPSTLDIRELIPVFHRWIQQQPISGHLLLDVRDYSHVPRGPGILLVGHQGDFNVDIVGDQVGFGYVRKQPPLESTTERLTAAMTALLEGSSLLESTAFPGGFPRFDPGSFQISIPDRLAAPNTEETFQWFQGQLHQFWQDILESDRFDIVHLDGPRDPFMVDVFLESPPSSQTLLSSFRIRTGQ